MKIIVTQENLRLGLSIVSRVVGNSATLPILNNVLFETENGLLKISGTNLETGISTYVRCQVEREGSICVGVKTINDLVNSLPQQNIVLDTENTTTKITTDNVNVSINHLSAEDFPIIPKIEDGQKAVVNAQELKKSLDQVVFAASNSETQPEISGVLLWFGGENVLITATDRYRLAEKSLSYQGKVDQKIIVPHRSIQEISRLITNIEGDLELSVTSTQLALSLDNIYIVSRLIDGNYPDYQQIIPENCNTTVIIDRGEFLSALKTTSVFSKGTGSVNFSYDSDQGIVKLNSLSHDLGEGTVDIVCKITGGSGNLIINYRYLLDYLNNLEQDSLVIKIIDETGPVTFVPENSNNYFYLVMPIKQ